MTTDGLNLTNLRLYGRQDEERRLNEALFRVQAGGPIETIFVYGAMGSGKSELVNSVFSPCERFVKGKFDQNKLSSEPYSALVAALSQLCSILRQSDSQSKWKHTLQYTLGNDGLVLANVISNITDLVGKQESLESDNDAASKRTAWSLEKLKRAIVLFLWTVASPDRPVIIFLDDLQWGDVSTFDILSCILTDKEIKGLLFVGAYRDTEVDNLHPLHISISDLQKDEHLPLSMIKLIDLFYPAVNNMLSELLPGTMHGDKLTRTIFNWTHGHPLFIVQFLKHLQHEGILHHSPTTMAWEFDAARFDSQSGLSLVDLIGASIQRLPADCKVILSLASCLGSKFEVDLLMGVAMQDIEFLSTSSTSQVESALRILEKQGIIHKVGDQDGTFMFVHDKHQEVALNLVPIGPERDALHYRIGTALLKLYKTSGDTKVQKSWKLLLAAVGQLNLSPNRTMTMQMKIDLANYNLEAAHIVFKKSAFRTAIEYLDAGIALIKETGDCWNTNYNLVLQLSTLQVEAYHCVGDVVSCQKNAQIVISNAQANGDKIRVYQVMIQGLGSEGKFKEALELGAHVLCELKESFPKRPSKFNVVKELVKTKILVRRFTDDRIRNLPPMTRSDKIAATNVLALICMYGYVGAMPNFLVSAGLMMMRLSLQYGLCEHSALSLASYGIATAHIGNFEEGYRFGCLALDLVDSGLSKEVSYRAVLFVHALLYHLYKPLRESLKPMLNSFNCAMEVGDLTYASGSGAMYCALYFFNGMPLGGDFQTDIKLMCERLERYCQASNLVLVKLYWQASLNLLGEAEDPLVFSGSAMEQAALERDQLQDTAVQGSYWALKMEVAYIYGDLTVCADMAEKLWTRPPEADGTIFGWPYNLFFLGLTAMGLAQTGMASNKIQMKRANAAIRGLEKWPVCHIQQFLDLLYAERAKLRKKPEYEVKRLFDTAIASASRSQLTQIQALANERAGIYLLEVDGGPSERARLQIFRSFKLYKAWNAYGKSNAMKAKYPFLVEMELQDEQENNDEQASMQVLHRVPRSSSHFRGRGRRVELLGVVEDAEDTGK